MQTFHCFMCVVILFILFLLLIRNLAPICSTTNQYAYFVANPYILAKRKKFCNDFYDFYFLTSACCVNIGKTRAPNVGSCPVVLFTKPVDSANVSIQRSRGVCKRGQNGDCSNMHTHASDADAKTFKTIVNNEAAREQIVTTRATSKKSNYVEQRQTEAVRGKS